MMKFAFYDSWTWRWLLSPGPEAQSLEQWGHWKWVVVLRLLCGVSLWQQWVSGIEPLRSWQQLCELSLVILVCPWHIPPGLSDWCGTTGDWLWLCLYTAVLVYLGFFCQPGVPRTSGISSIRITYPTHWRWALMMVASKQDVWSNCWQASLANHYKWFWFSLDALNT